MEIVGLRERNDILNLVDSGGPDMVFAEVAEIAHSMDPDFPVESFRAVFNDVKRLYEGSYPGYRAGDTPYHDFNHTLQTVLALSRLMHGCYLDHDCVYSRGLFLGLVSALMHDTGYIPEDGETEGTGARFTLVHISRGIAFMQHYCERHGFSKEDISFIRHCIQCTEIRTDIDSIGFSSTEEKTIGKMLGMSDLLGQMADRCYPEKLLLLYGEFVEGKIDVFTSERDLLAKTVHFFDQVKERFDTAFDGMHQYLAAHFRLRWGIDSELYIEAIGRNIAYIDIILQSDGDDYRDLLKRNDIVDRLRQDVDGMT